MIEKKKSLFQYKITKTDSKYHYFIASLTVAIATSTICAGAALTISFLASIAVAGTFCIFHNLSF